MKLRLIALTLTFFFFISCNRPVSEAITYEYIHTVQIPSISGKMERKAHVILPQSYYEDSLKYPVVYLLHGFGGNYSDWNKKCSNLSNLASLHEMIIVTPDGSKDSWYFDQKNDSTAHFYTYIFKDVPQWIDNHYRTKAEAKSRGVTGLSMGGHGGLWGGCQDYISGREKTFGVVGSMSGGLDLAASKNQFVIAEKAPKDMGENISFLGIIDDLNPEDVPHIIIDCGVDDFFYAANMKVHELLLKKGIDHDFIVRPGEHNWDYWCGAIEPQLVFMKSKFRE